MRIATAPLLLTSVASLALAGCVTDPVTGEREIARPAATGALGAGIGAGLGAILGGKSKRTEVLIGTGIGAVAGTAVGVYLDEQEKKLRAATQGTGVEVERTEDALLLNMPSSVTFPVNSSAVSPRFEPVLNEVAQVLDEYERSFVDVYGYTDSTGTEAYNQQLSEQRAESVGNYLVRQGVNSARIETRGFGETNFVATNETEEGRSQNRRVEIKIVPITDSPAA